MVRQSGITLGKHHGFATSGEILQLKDGHSVPLAGGDLTQLSDHRDGTDLGLVRLLLKRPQTDGCKESSTGSELLERMVGQIKAKQLLLQLELLGWAVIRHRSSLGSEA